MLFSVSLLAHSLLKPPIDRVCYLRANRASFCARLHVKRAAVHLFGLVPTAERGMHTLLSKQPCQFALHCRADGGTVARREAVQHEFFDMQFDVVWLHTQPPISASVSAFSSLVYSPRAARSRCAMRTGSPASAARKAALSAMLRIFPPVTLRRARREMSSPSVGLLAGTMRRQISARCAASGNGTCTMKRIRRKKALSSAFFRFVVRTASPRYASMRCKR